MEPEIRYEYKKIMGWEDLLRVFVFSNAVGAEKFPSLLWEADHSMGGRIVTPQGSECFSEYISDPDFAGTWYGWEEKNVYHVQFTSASSGSRLSAIRHQKVAGWEVTLSVPQRDGKPYEGAYWKAFHGQ